MTVNIEFYFDYLSPFTYLAHGQLASLGKPIDYKPVSITDVMKLVNNQPSPKCPAKARYAMVDAKRWAQRYGVPLGRNQALWAGLVERKVEGRLFMRGAVVAQQLGCLESYSTAMFNAVWRDGRDLVSGEGREAVLGDAGLDGADIWRRTNAPEIASELERRVQEAADKGVFGSPTFIVDDEMFFGNDRLDFIRARLDR